MMEDLCVFFEEPFTDSCLDMEPTIADEVRWNSDTWHEYKSEYESDFLFCILSIA